MNWSGIVYAFSINNSAVSFLKLFDPCASITNHKMKKYNNMCHLLVYQGPPIATCVPEPTYLCTRAHQPMYQSPPICLLVPT